MMLLEMLEKAKKLDDENLTKTIVSILKVQTKLKFGFYRASAEMAYAVVDWDKSKFQERGEELFKETMKLLNDFALACFFLDVRGRLDEINSTPKDEKGGEK